MYISAVSATGQNLRVEYSISNGGQCGQPPGVGGGGGLTLS